MKKYLYAGLLAATLCAPALAQNKFVATAPDEPLHRRTIVLCVAVLIGLRACTLHKTLASKRQG